MHSREPASARPRLERLWERRLALKDYPLWTILALAAGLYRCVVYVRNLFWRAMKRQAAMPVISVGNLTVGGNGKTPFTLYLARRLSDQGYRVAIVSRGYSRESSRERATRVASHGELTVGPQAAGDEPAMMAKSFDGPIVVARRRIHGIELLRTLGHFDAVILDDGFQHQRLARDVDIVLVSSERGLGNGWMLPAGPMREPLSAAGRADAIVLMSSGAGDSALRPSQMKRLAARTLLRATARPRALVVSEQGGWRETPLPLGGRRVLAVSGLASPGGFYAMLRELEADLVGVLEYPDHHVYTSADWQSIVTAMKNADLVVTTEKDLVKLERFPFARDTLYALRLEVKMEPADARVLDELIAARLKRPGWAAQG